MPRRAAVLIGVKKTGGTLPTLNAVGAGVEAMATWARGQPGMGTVVVLSDSNEPDGTALPAGAPPSRKVTADDILEAVDGLIRGGGTDQLFVYFAGHGANVRHGEYWLLSGAPRNPNEAVNVQASFPLARLCGIPHVVLISDACRTVAASAQSHAVTGSSIFPNDPPSTKPGCVDLFYATLVGKPSLEVGNEEVAAKFEAVYTTSLIDGLNGRAPVDEAAEDGGRRVRLVRSWSLQSYLETAVPERLDQLGVALGVTQTPDAQIGAKPTMWLAQLGDPGDPARTTRGATRGATRGGGSTTRGTARSSATRPPSLVGVAGDAVRAALADAGRGRSRGGSRGSTRGGTHGATRGATRGGTRGGTPAPEEALFGEMVERSAAPVDPGHFETRCGFKVVGAGVRTAVSAGADVELLDGPGGLVRVDRVEGAAANVLLVFDDGRGALLPAIPEFIAMLTYEDGELANVSYEPSDNSQQWSGLREPLAELRELRRVVAAATRLGVFRPDALEGREAIVGRMRDVKWLDPTMAVYSAYALHAHQQGEMIDEVQSCLRTGLGLSLFDVAMLARRPGSKPSRMPDDVFPAVPMLAQGWALLGTFGVELPASLRRAGMQQHVTNSLWTLFEEPGVAAVRAAITSGEIR